MCLELGGRGDESAGKGNPRISASVSEICKHTLQGTQHGKKREKESAKLRDRRRVGGTWEGLQKLEDPCCGERARSERRNFRPGGPRRDHGRADFADNREKKKSTLFRFFLVTFSGDTSLDVRIFRFTHVPLHNPFLEKRMNS